MWWKMPVWSGKDSWRWWHLRTRGETLQGRWNSIWCKPGRILTISHIAASPTLWRKGTVPGQEVTYVCSVTSLGSGMQGRTGGQAGLVGAPSAHSSPPFPSWVLAALSAEAIWALATKTPITCEKAIAYLKSSKAPDFSFLLSFSFINSSYPFTNP